MRRGFTKIELLIVVAILFIIVGMAMPVGCAGGLGSGYSDGDRVGHVIKLSRKGIVHKSWEGELDALEEVRGERGVTMRYWRFSVRDPGVIAQLRAAAETGARVRVHYNQYMIKPVTLDTPYVVDSVTVLDAAPAAGAVK